MRTEQAKMYLAKLEQQEKGKNYTVLCGGQFDTFIRKTLNEIINRKHRPWNDEMFNDLVNLHENEKWTLSACANFMSEKYNREISRNSCIGAYDRYKKKSNFNQGEK